MNNNNVEIIKPTLKTICIKQNREIKLIRACAYCRVSTDNEDQKTSYESQRIHYKNMIEENPNGEMIKDNLPNNKLKIGSDMGHYGFSINKQSLEIKEDNVSAYVLRKNSYINTTSHSFPPFIKFREILKYFSYVSSQISKMYSLKLKFFQKLCNFFNIVLLIMFFNIKRLI